jgi:hypothetical protein
MFYSRGKLLAQVGDHKFAFGSLLCTSLSTLAQICTISSTEHRGQKTEYELWINIQE